MSESITNQTLFDQLVSEAVKQPIAGWDFSYIANRWRHRTTPPWDYDRRVKEAIAGSRSMLDIGTGGGERLASYAPLPPDMWATEAYPPNVSIARARLGPLGVTVVQIASKRSLPFEANRFDTVINRHEAFWATELFRVLKPGGRLITQQVGNRHFLGLNERLLGRKIEMPALTSRDRSVQYLQDAGLVVLETAETFTETAFLDVGAIVFYLRMVPWQAPEFDIDRSPAALGSIHNHIQEHGELLVHGHSYFIEAQKPA